MFLPCLIICIIVWFILKLTKDSRNAKKHQKQQAIREDGVYKPSYKWIEKAGGVIVVGGIIFAIIVGIGMLINTDWDERARKKQEAEIRAEFTSVPAEKRIGNAVKLIEDEKFHEAYLELIWVSKEEHPEVNALLTYVNCREDEQNGMVSGARAQLLRRDITDDYSGVLKEK